MEKELLQKALNSILHGSTRVITTTNDDGSISSYEERINDLRVPLVNRLARELANTKEFRKALSNVFSEEVIKKIREKMLENVSFRDLPYSIRERLGKEMKETKLEIRKYKLVAEGVENKDKE